MFVLFCPTSKIHALYPVKEPYKQVQEILSRLLREYSSPFLSLSKRFLLLANYPCLWRLCNTNLKKT